MNGIHDMGGMHGFGPVDVHDGETFHEDWEKHASALSELAVGAGYINLDAFRAEIELMEPAAYLNASYFERWLHAVESGLIDRGYLTRAEVDSRIREIADGLGVTNAPALQPSISIQEIDFDNRIAVQRFEIGDRVRVLNLHPPTHTRAPRYLRGKAGVIRRCHGHEVFPDTNSRYQGDSPQVVYSITFEGREIWGASSDPALWVSIDLWDSYLELA